MSHAEVPLELKAMMSTHHVSGWK